MKVDAFFVGRGQENSTMVAWYRVLHKFGGASAIKVNFIAFGFHKFFCNFAVSDGETV